MQENIKLISTYPKISKDISLKIPNHITNEQALNLLKIISQKIKSSDLKISIKLFDNYEGQENQNSRKLGYTLTYQSNTRTLLKTEIDNLTEQIVENINKKL